MSFTDSFVLTPKMNETLEKEGLSEGMIEALVCRVCDTTEDVKFLWGIEGEGDVIMEGTAMVEGEEHGFRVSKGVNDDGYIKLKINVKETSNQSKGI